MTTLNHPAELALHGLLEKVVKGQASFSQNTAEQIADDIKEAILKQFNAGGKRDFKLRMSNVGRPYCQLWFDKNKSDEAQPKPTTFVINMLLGDIVEAVFKGLLTEAGVQYKNSEQVELDIGSERDSISGTYDIAIDGSVDDIKSASDWSYKNKFESYTSLKSGDAFGYVGQLAGYAKASWLKPGGWWVVNKSNGQFKYVKADIDIDEELIKIKEVSDKLKRNKFERCYEAIDETFRGKLTGNKMLGKECTFCNYKHSCWPTLKVLPAVKSQAKEPKMVHYVHMTKENINE